MKIEIPERMIVKELNESIYGAEQEMIENNEQVKAGIVEKLIDGVTDNALALLVVGSAIYQSVNMTMLPDWHIAAVGAVMAYYFAKKN